MKSSIFVLIIALVIASCSSPAAKQEGRDTTDTAKADASAFDQKDIGSREICFVHTEGAKNKDSTLVHLSINGYKVSGLMEWIPYGKDSRKGHIYGKKTGNLIKVTWTFKQEEVTDSLKAEFKLNGNKLSQKPYKTNSQNGALQTDTTANYTISYNKADCSKLGMPVKF